MITCDMGTTGPAIGFYTEEVFLTNMFSASPIFCPYKNSRKELPGEFFGFTDFSFPTSKPSPSIFKSSRSCIVFRGVYRFVSLETSKHRTWGFGITGPQKYRAKTPYCGDIWMDRYILGVQQKIHPQSLAWNLKMIRNLLFQGLIFRFHVKLPGCTVPGLSLINGLVWIIQIPLWSNFEFLGWIKLAIYAMFKTRPKWAPQNGGGFVRENFLFQGNLGEIWEFWPEFISLQEFSCEEFIS